VSVFNKSTRQVLSYGVLQQQKRGVITWGLRPGGGLSYLRVSNSILLLICLYVLPFLRYSASNNGVTLKSVLGVVRSMSFRKAPFIHHIRLTIDLSLQVLIALSCTITIFNLFDVG